MTQSSESSSSDLPALAEPRDPWPSNSLRQFIPVLDPVGTNYRERDTTYNQPEEMSRMDDIAIDENDIIIAVMGPTGAGMTSFINCAVGGEVFDVGHDLASCTMQIQSVRYPHPDGARNFVLVDTPGFNDTFISDFQILRIIAEWLQTTYKRKVFLSGLLYFHRISDNAMGGTALRDVTIFRQLCGDANSKNVVFVTTMWDEVLEDVSLQRENELLNHFWAMTKLGSITCRFHNTEESAWEIINAISISPPEERRPLLIQQEVVDEHKPLHKTLAGKTALGSITGTFSIVKRFFGQSNRDSTGRKDDRDESFSPPRRHRLSRSPSTSSISLHSSNSSSVTFDGSLMMILERQWVTAKQISEQVKAHGDPAAVEELKEEYRRILAQLQEVLKEMEKLKTPSTERIMLFLSTNHRLAQSK